VQVVRLLRRKRQAATDRQRPHLEVIQRVHVLVFSVAHAVVEATIGERNQVPATLRHRCELGITVLHIPLRTTRKGVLRMNVAY
jgi:hypothetical protein